MGTDPLMGLRSTFGAGLSSMFSGFAGTTLPMQPGALPTADNLAAGTEAQGLMQNPFAGMTGMTGLDSTGTLASMMNTYMQLMQFAQQFQMACLQNMAQNMGLNGQNGANGLGQDGNNAIDGGGGNNANDGGGGALDINENNNAAPVDGKVNLGPHGEWAGTQGPVQDIVGTLGKGFSVSSAKRATQMTASGNVSDHYIGNKTAYANDVVWGSSTPTASSDAAASKIIQELGGPANWGSKGGVFNKTINGIRYQVLYKTNVGGNHFNHIHIGAKRV
jgi:hypothetical protein